MENAVCQLSTETVSNRALLYSEMVLVAVDWMAWDITTWVFPVS